MGLPFIVALSLKILTLLTIFYYYSNRYYALFDSEGGALHGGLEAHI